MKVITLSRKVKDVTFISVACDFYSRQQRVGSKTLKRRDSKRTNKTNRNYSTSEFTIDYASA